VAPFCLGTENDIYCACAQVTYDMSMSQLAANLRRFRKGAKLTQAQVADRAQVDLAKYRGLERGIGTVDAIEMARLAGALLLPFTELLTS